MSDRYDMNRWVLETTLPEAECKLRLKSKLRGILDSGWNPDKPLYGAVTRRGFAVQLTPGRGRGVNPYYVRGMFVPGPLGTTIRATYGVSTAYRVFLTGLASYFLGMGWLVFRASAPAGFSPFIGLTACVMVMFVYLRTRNMKSFADADRDLVLGTVMEILEARLSERPQAIA